MSALAWLILIIVLGLVEMSTMSLVSVWFIIGAVGAMIASLCGLNLWIQLTIFLITSIVFLILTRPFVKRVLRVKRISTNADRAIGEKAIVLETINNLKSSGQVKVMGQVWTARTVDDNDIISEGELVKVVSITGNKLIVKSFEN